jgi:hypothetical protein
MFDLIFYAVFIYIYNTESMIYLFDGFFLFICNKNKEILVLFYEYTIDSNAYTGVWLSTKCVLIFMKFSMDLIHFPVIPVFYRVVFRHQNNCLSIKHDIIEIYLRVLI